MSVLPSFVLTEGPPRSGQTEMDLAGPGSWGCTRGFWDRDIKCSVGALRGALGSECAFRTPGCLTLTSAQRTLCSLGLLSLYFESARGSWCRLGLHGLHGSGVVCPVLVRAAMPESSVPRHVTMLKGGDRESARGTEDSVTSFIPEHFSLTKCLNLGCSVWY